MHHSHRRQNREFKAAFDAYLPFVDTCHVVGIFLHKCWPLLRFPRTVGIFDTSQTTRHCLCTCQVGTCSIPTTRLCLTSELCVCVCVCVWPIIVIRFRLLRPGQSTRVVGTLSELQKHLV